LLTHVIDFVVIMVDIVVVYQYDHIISYF